MTTINEYNNSFIYKIISTASNFQEQYTYYGSTKQTLNNRMNSHRTKYINNNLDCSSKKVFDMYGMDNCFIEKVENCNCNDKYELKLIEAFYIKNHPCCNDRLPSAIKADNMTEYNKEYKRIHKEEIKEYMKEYNKEYRESHTEERKERMILYRLKKSQDPIWKAQDNERKRLYRLKKSQDPEYKEREKERNRLYYLNKKAEKENKN
jgi:hypothetical protein